MIRRFFICIVSLFCLGTGAVVVAKQDNCLALIESAVSTMAGICQGLQTGTACSPQTPEVRQSLTQLNHIETSSPGGISVLQLEDGVVLLSGDASLERLANDRTWHFTGNADEGDCDEKQGTLTLLVPEDRTFTLSLNGVDFALASAYVVLQYQSPNSLSLTIMRGELQLEDGTAVQAGTTIVAVTDNSGTIVFWSAPRPVNEHERQVVDAGAVLLNALLNTTIVYGAICEAVTHIVQPGENLFRIAINYNTTLDEVMASNHLIDSTIHPGQAVTIPCVDQPVETPLTCDTNATHTVRDGDNLFRIALNYGSSVDAIKAANSLTSNTIVVGEQLLVPCGTQPVTPNTAASAAPPPVSIQSQQDVCHRIAVTFPSCHFPVQLVNSVRALCN